MRPSCAPLPPDLASRAKRVALALPLLAPRFFGGVGGFGGFGGGEQEPETQKGRTVVVDLEVTLRDLYLGRVFEVLREKAEYKPAKGTRKCNCKTRMATRQIAPGMYQQYPTQTCEDCPAVKLVRSKEALQVEVEPGMRDGHEITFFEQGEPLLDGEPGDLKFRLRTVASANAAGVPFERRGDDLLVAATVTLTDALVGFERQMLHLDGKAVPLRAEGVTRPGDVARLPGQGMPVNGHGRRFGDMYVSYSVQMPAALTDAQKKTVRELFKDAF